MRTSILLDDKLGEQLKARARQRGMSLSAFLAEAGRAALRAETDSAQEPFDLVTFGRQGAQPGVDLDRTNALIAAEDEERYSS